MRNIHALVFVLFCIVLSPLTAQIDEMNIIEDTFRVKDIPLSELSFSRKFDNELVRGNKRYYDFGITLNVLKRKLNVATTLGFSPFFDIHVVDNKGYSKYGFRVFAEFNSSEESSYKIALGPALYNGLKSGFSYKKVEPLGFSGEFSYFISPHFGLTSRWDLIGVTSQNSTKTISDVSIGIKVRPTGLVSALGYLFGIGSMGFNGILNSL